VREAATRHAEVVMTAPVIHVKCTDTGNWLVHPEDCDEPISEHPNETLAELAALEHAAARGNGEVVVHDRYRRVHRASIARDERRA
jgi:hypothetical protein